MSFKERHPEHYKRLREFERREGMSYIQYRLSEYGAMRLKDPADGTHIDARRDHLLQYVLDRETEIAAQRRRRELIIIAAITLSGAILGSWLSGSPPRQHQSTPVPSPQKPATVEDEARPCEDDAGESGGPAGDGRGEQPRPQQADEQAASDDSGDSSEPPQGDAPSEAPDDRKETIPTD